MTSAGFLLDLELMGVNSEFDPLEIFLLFFLFFPFFSDVGWEPVRWKVPVVVILVCEEGCLRCDRIVDVSS